MTVNATNAEQPATSLIALRLHVIRVAPYYLVTLKVFCRKMFTIQKTLPGVR